MPQKASGNGSGIVGPKQDCGLPDREAASVKEEARRRYLASSAGHPDKAAAEQLEARALLLGGQAGLCCNPGCASRCQNTSRPLPATLQLPIDSFVVRLWLDEHMRHQGARGNV